MLSDGERHELDGQLRELGIKLGHRCGVLSALPELCAMQRAERDAWLKAAGVSKMGHRFAVLRLLGESGHLPSAATTGGAEACSPTGASPFAAAVSSRCAKVEAAPPASQPIALAASGAERPSRAEEVGPSSLAARVFVVVHAPLVFIREHPDGDARKLGYKWRGERLAFSEERGAWLKLALEEGWMLQDGSTLGLGLLLRPLAARQPALTAPTEDGPPLLQLPLEPAEAETEQIVSVGELLMRQLFEQKFPKSTPRPEAVLQVRMRPRMAFTPIPRCRRLQ